MEKITDMNKQESCMNNDMDEIKILRKDGIAGRDSLDKDIRMAKSQKIVEQILSMEEFKSARTIMIYKGIRGEVRLSGLEKSIEAEGKKFLYPLCVGDGIMIALHPKDDTAWKKGSFGISEPLRELSEEVAPEHIDLMICPCTVFDVNCNRIGMGGGYYDRFLPQCKNAHIVAVAFEAQKASSIPVQPWDQAMEAVISEDKIYRHN